MQKNTIRQNSKKNGKIEKIRKNYCTGVKIMVLF